MHLPSFLVLALATCIYAISNIKVASYKPVAYQAASPNTVTEHVLFLERSIQKTTKAAYLKAVRDQASGKQVGTANLTSSENSQQFQAPITFGTQIFKAYIDTGSSDTWLIRSGFQCFNSTGAHAPESHCAFGPAYQPGSNFHQIPNENFNASYADGTSVAGVLGREHVTLAGITVNDQEVAVVDRAYTIFNNVSSGIIGLSFPRSTSAFRGNNPSDDTASGRVHYSPIFTSMYTDGSVAPLFSMALTRGTWGGTLAIGGLPNVAYDGTFATAKFQIMTVDNSDSDSPAQNTTSSSKPQFEFYVITVQGFQVAGTYYGQHVGTFTTDVFGPPDDPETEMMIIDSGSTLISLSDDVAEVVNLLFDPPARYDERSGVFIVECDATPPEFGVDIDGQIFFINAEDMIITDITGICYTGISGSGGTGGTLGDVFLKNVLAVFDVGASEMRFAARVNY